MRKFKNLSLLTIILLIISSIFQPKLAFSEETGRVLNGLTRYDLIDATGIGGPSIYSADKKSISFTFQFNFKFNIAHERTLMVIDVEPELAPYVDHLEVVDNMGHSTTPRSKFSLKPTSPGTFVFNTERAIQTCACGFTHTGMATIVLNTPVDQLPKDMYVYSLRLVFPRLNNEYVNRSRLQGVIEKNPDNYNILDIDYGVFKSILGYNTGRPLSSDNTLQVKYCVSFAYAPIRSCNFIFKFDPQLVNYIDRVEVYSSVTNGVVSSESIPQNGIVSVPLASVYPRISFFRTMPINAKVYFKDGITIGSLPNDSYKVMTMTTSSSVTGSTAILKNSLCTTGFLTHNIK